MSDEDLFDKFAVTYADAPKHVPSDADDDDVRACECGLPTTWDPEREGTTCGGNYVRGAFVCACGKSYIGANTHGAKSPKWKINKGGRSVDGEGVRIRCEGDGAEELMKRIVRLPELERLEREMIAGRAQAKPDAEDIRLEEGMVA